MDFFLSRNCINTLVCDTQLCRMTALVIVLVEGNVSSLRGALTTGLEDFIKAKSLCGRDLNDKLPEEASSKRTSFVPNFPWEEKLPMVDVLCKQPFCPAGLHKK